MLAPEGGETSGKAASTEPLLDFGCLCLLPQVRCKPCTLVEVARRPEETTFCFRCFSLGNLAWREIHILDAPLEDGVSWKTRSIFWPTLPGACLDGYVTVSCVGHRRGRSCSRQGQPGCPRCGVRGGPSRFDRRCKHPAV